MNAHGTTDTSAWSVIFGVVMFIALWTLEASIMRRRKKAMSEMALRLGLEAWPDDDTPRGLSLHGTVFQSWSRLFNVYEGFLNGKQVAVFDFRKKGRKSSWSRTIIAVKTTHDIFQDKPFRLEAKQVGAWQLLYSPPGFLLHENLMHVAEVEELLKGIGRA